MDAKSLVGCTKGIRGGAIIGGMGTSLLETTGERLKWARMRQKKTQKGLGREVGVRDVYISQLESNTYRGSRALIARLAAALGVSIAFLELETDDPTPANAWLRSLLRVTVQRNRVQRGDWI